MNLPTIIVRPEAREEIPEWPEWKALIARFREDVYVHTYSIDYIMPKDIVGPTVTCPHCGQVIPVERVHD